MFKNSRRDNISPTVINFFSDSDKNYIINVNPKKKSKLQEIQSKRKKLFWHLMSAQRDINSIDIFNTNYISEKEKELTIHISELLNKVIIGYLDTNKQFGLKVPENRCFCGNGAKYSINNRYLCYTHLKKEILSDFTQNQWKVAKNLGINLSVYKTNEIDESISKKDLDVVRYIVADNKVYGALLKDKNQIKWLYLEIQNNKVYYKFDNNSCISIFNTDNHYKVPKEIGINLIEKFIPKNKYLSNLLTKITKNESTLSV